MQQASRFHPAVAAWFAQALRTRRPSRRRSAWPQIQAGRNVLVAAPTGSGKTLAAFLAAIDDLVREGVESGLPDETLGRLRLAAEGAVERHQNEPRGAARRHSPRARGARACPTSRSARWCAPATRRSTSARGMRKRPPHIVVTTPESLYVLLGSESGRSMLATTRTVIVDEIHALASQQARQPPRAVARAARGADAERRRVRIGLSATQKPIEDGRALPRRRRRQRRRARLRDRRRRPRPRARPRARSSRRRRSRR